MLKLYYKAYNLDGGLHKLFYDFDNYVSFLGGPALQFQLHDYRINRNEIRVAMPNEYESELDKILYAIDDRRDSSGNGYYRCYIVNYGVVEAGYCVFNVSVDWWASYIARCYNNSRLHVTRCNRNIGNGLYDDISAFDENSTYALSETFAPEQLAIVYVVSGATGNTTFLQGAGSFTRMFYSPLSAFAGSPISKAFTNAVETIQGIYTIAGSTNIDAQPIKAYVVPLSWITAGNQSVISFNSQTTGSASVALTPAGTVAGGVSRVTYTGTIDPDYDTYLGTRLNGLKLSRVTGTYNAEIVIVTNSDSMQIIVKQGGNMLDITSSFAVGLTMNDSATTTMEKIQSTINMASSVAQGVTSIAGGNYAGGISGIAKAAVSIYTPNNSHYVGGGDAFATIVQGDNLYNPIKRQLSKSIDDEKKHARHLGATFDEYVYLNALTAYSLIGTDANFTHTFVKGDGFLTSDIPAEAAAEIKRRLRDGIYLDEITGA